MLKGVKPMAVFYRVMRENIDETNGQPFSDFVKSKFVKRTIFYIKNEKQNFKIIYYVYTIEGEEWRADVYKTIKK